MWVCLHRGLDWLGDKSFVIRAKIVFDKVPYREFTEIELV